jgi:hypothetical protein
MEREKIAQAVSACLAACYGASDPLVRLAAFMDALKKDSNWTQAEVWAVETQSLKLLNLLVARPVRVDSEAPLAGSPGKIDTPCQPK